jgi:hypothetical protein
MAFLDPASLKTMIGKPPQIMESKVSSKMVLIELCIGSQIGFTHT